MIYFKLNDILERKEITKYSLSKMTKIDNNTIAKICNNESKQIKLETIEKICVALNITPNDLLEVSAMEVSIVGGSLSNTKTWKSPYYEYNPNMSLSDIEQHYASSIKYQEKKQKEDEENYQAYLENKQEIDEWSYTLQTRFLAELRTDESVSNFLNKLVEIYASSFEINENIQQLFKRYDKHDFIETESKVRTYYRILQPLLSEYSNDVVLKGTLVRIYYIYTHNGLEKLSNEELNELEEVLNYYSNNELSIKKD